MPGRESLDLGIGTGEAGLTLGKQEGARFNGSEKWRQRRMKPETTLPSPLPLVRQIDTLPGSSYSRLCFIYPREQVKKDKVAIVHMKTWRWITGRA